MHRPILIVDYKAILSEARQDILKYRNAQGSRLYGIAHYLRL